MLSLDTSKGITKFLGDPDDKTGNNWVVATSIAHYTGLKVLFNLRSGETDAGLTPSDIAIMSQRTRELADLIFIDISGEPPEVWQSSLNNFDVVLLVTDSGPDGLDNARVAASSFLKDVTKAKGLVVVDRDGALSDLEFSKMKPIVESSVGIPLVQIVPHDLKIPLEFEQRGLPIVLADSNRPAALAMTDLGQRLAEPHFGTSDERGQDE
jgi:MinD-like ATPase involved in chromosome partitioning or flagellar assembly